MNMYCNTSIKKVKWKYLINPKEDKEKELWNMGHLDLNNEMVSINPVTSSVTLNTNRLNIPS